MSDRSLSDWVQGEFADFEIPGAAVALVANGRESVMAFGVRRIGRSARVNADTVFSLASCSKAFTAFAVGRLVDRGVLGFDDPIVKHLPELALDTPEITAQATLRDCLGMRLGLQPLGACHWGRSRNFTHAQMFRRLRHLPRIAPFREGFVYFNPAYSALAETIARASRMRFATFMAREVFAPLRMRRTFVEERPLKWRTNIAFPHVKTARGVIPLSAPHCGGREGESCQYTSAADLLPWLRFHLTGSAPSGRCLLSAGTMEALRTIQMSIPWPDGEAGYCMGWMRGKADGRVVLTHEGGEFGASTFAVVCPEKQVALAVLLSRRAAACVRSLAYGLLDRVVGGPIKDRKQEFLDLDKKEEEGALAYLESNFAVDPTQPMPDLNMLAGAYHSDHSGRVTLTRDRKLLRAKFEDIDVYNCRLQPLGGSVFRLVDFDELGLQQEVRGDARLRISTRGGVPVIDAPGLGLFQRVS